MWIAAYMPFERGKRSISVEKSRRENEEKNSGGGVLPSPLLHKLKKITDDILEKFDKKRDKKIRQEKGNFA